MNPTNQTLQYRPQVAPYQQPVTAASNKKRTILALWLMIAPTALIVVTLIAYALINFIAASTAPSSSTQPQPDFGTDRSLSPTSGPDDESQLFEKPSPVKSIANVVLFGIGALALLPGLIIGIILLATKKPVTPQLQ